MPVGTQQAVDRNTGRRRQATSEEATSNIPGVGVLDQTPRRDVIQGLNHVFWAHTCGIQDLPDDAVGQLQLPGRVLRVDSLAVHNFTAQKPRGPDHIVYNYPRHVGKLAVPVPTWVDGFLLPAHGHHADLNKGVWP